MKQLSRDAAVENLKQFFQGTDSNSITVQNLFRVMGRDDFDEAQNRGWLSNKLSDMRKYNFINKEITNVNGKLKLTKISLTPEGKQALGRSTSEKAQVNPQDTASLLEAVNQNVEVLRQRLPSFDVVFDIKPKEGPR